MFKPGDRVRVVERSKIHFDDYVVGDVATVQSVDPNGDLWVRWETNLGGAAENGRCPLLHQYEVGHVS